MGVLDVRRKFFGKGMCGEQQYTYMSCFFDGKNFLLHRRMMYSGSFFYASEIPVKVSPNFHKSNTACSNFEGKLGRVKYCQWQTGRSV